MSLKRRLKGWLGPRGMVWVRSLRAGFELPDWGNLRRVQPFSSNFGFERGAPVDRHYLHKFLEAKRSVIVGDVLEIQVTSYTERFGSGVTSAASLDVDPQHGPTYLCDLAEADRLLPANSFDCFLLPNTLQYPPRLEESLRQAYRLVRPGGSILASAAGLLPLIPDGPEREYWRFTPSGWRSLLERLWPDAALEIQGHGNCLAMCASAMGLAIEELTTAELDHHDPRFPVLVTIHARKPQ